MAEASRSTKRRRSSATAKSIVILEPGESCNPAKGQETFTRDAHFWLEDGNLILLAGTTAFRVYRGILVKKSAVFADMFDTGSLDATETFDGCPVVRLPDHPEDPRDFFQYLITCLDLSLSKAGPVRRASFAQLHAAFHLAHKYQCPDVEARALFALKKYYTANFTQYTSFDEVEISSLRKPPMRASIAAVNIARLTETPSMLPYALYLAATCEGCMVDGYKRRDGSVEYLSSEDLRSCIDVRGALAREHASLVKCAFSLRAPSAGCRTPGVCPTAREEILSDVELNAPGTFDVLYSYAEYIKDWGEVDDLCGVCRRGMLDREAQERRRVWKLLPGIFLLNAGKCGFATDSDADDSE
ncbi:hypothetical protein GSI_12285 [Ganoderma sinense ZZ0214-1]|uniref:BTB domain-containing protein n=1 Tax=Ganoderma sinense ZZ0214-1 TaxID=1077348 RepID=A0A2G8RYG7_9APHY|nr:hypothetical protein GSI_12285 [Ganoderma sinense ZZ0214-1]